MNHNNNNKKKDKQITQQHWKSLKYVKDNVVTNESCSSCGDCQRFWFRIWHNDGIVAFWLVDYFWSVANQSGKVLEALVNGSERCVRIKRADFNIGRLVQGVIYLATNYENIMSKGCNNALWDAHLW